MRFPECVGWQSSHSSQSKKKQKKNKLYTNRIQAIDRGSVSITEQSVSTTEESVLIAAQSVSIAEQSVSITTIGIDHGQKSYSYLCTYDLYDPVHNVFDASRAQPPPTCPSNKSARIKNHYAQGRINRRWFYVQKHRQTDVQKYKKTYIQSDRETNIKRGIRGSYQGHRRKGDLL
jgi:hypothetical protein